MWSVGKWLVKDFAPSSITYFSVSYIWLKWKCEKHRDIFCICESIHRRCKGISPHFQETLFCSWNKEKNAYGTQVDVDWWVWPSYIDWIFTFQHARCSKVTVICFWTLFHFLLRPQSFKRLFCLSLFHVIYRYVYWHNLQSPALCSLEFLQYLITPWKSTRWNRVCII